MAGAARRRHLPSRSASSSPGALLVVLSEAWLDVLLSAALLWALLAGRPRPRAHTHPGRWSLGGVAFLLPSRTRGSAARSGPLRARARLETSGRSAPGPRALPAAAAAAAVAAVACWTERNAAVLGRPIPLKSNSWFELHLANVDAADGLPRMETVLRRLPYFDTGEFNRYSRLGEMRYVDSFREPALAAVRTDPLHFAGNVLRRLRLAVAFRETRGRRGPATLHAFPPGPTWRAPQRRRGN